MYKVSYFVFAPDTKRRQAGVTVKWLCRSFDFSGNFLVLEDATKDGVNEETHSYIALQPKSHVTIDRIT